MDAASRARAAEKRDLLQLRLQRRQVSTTYRQVGCKLRRQGVRFSKLMPEAVRLALGSLASGPGQDERLLWASVPNSICKRWNDERQRDEFLTQAVRECASAGALVAVIWHPRKAAVCLRTEALCQYSNLIFDEIIDTTWIVDARESSWLVEVAEFDREICWSNKMPSA